MIFNIHVSDKVIISSLLTFNVFLTTCSIEFTDEALEINHHCFVVWAAF